MAFGRDVYYGHGKIEILPKVAVQGVEDVAIAFTPGVGHAVKLIASEPEAIHEQTAKDNMIALVTDGTALLGYGDIGPRAGMPVMEGKAFMFKLLAGVNCMLLCVDARGPDLSLLKTWCGSRKLMQRRADRCGAAHQQLGTR